MAKLSLQKGTTRLARVVNMRGDVDYLWQVRCYEAYSYLKKLRIHMESLSPYIRIYMMQKPMPIIYLASISLIDT
uniref:Uncharacterized protein n=1 Tax=Solanum lycopersicum TaxID=4081 RepID=A0A3Q7I1R4_SOLLC